ncbi:hypothetical protein HJFPF1_12559 [Paramyrothecium foliicola]|nr:hypothetical protein HJFPF1_12559 [Paramyrothecium foliicola]
MLVSKKTLALCAFAVFQVGAVDYGTWSINIVTGASASGYRYGDMYATHSKNPGVTSHSHWQYDPSTQKTTYTPDDPTLSNTEIDATGVQNFAIQQTVPIDGTNTVLKGSGSIDIQMSSAANGRGGEGSTTITAELAS